ncbi:hypothetical protein FHX49_001400 [Microbacterium endophyticum]|uniref:Uncharacterized protein n=1 Tax=Microbacterium endophyticum TaxID=1526412 RepID=A0A7W4YM48_9MICO|nr:hypothetical protein [Microbacterium endophyticum]MBB2975833.1 hypothetical protein [Microbacterium endophyticum]NIK36316.1 hypothetical protein [Microbacterium endophyticum]
MTRDDWNSSHAPTLLWQSGAWEVHLRDDELADISYDGRRVLRSIRAVARDRDWNTAGWVIDSVSRKPEELTLRLRTRDFGADLAGDVHVRASDRALTVEFEALSAVEWETNRTGLVVLHPPLLAGAELQATHPDGSTSVSHFPVEISAHQPVFDIAGLAWQHAGLAVDVAFSGDVFEMEDQRNWTDASFKTYSRPLSLPFPYRLAPDSRVSQSVTVTVSPLPDASPAVRSPVAQIRLAAAGAPFPAVGVSAATGPDPAPALEPIGSELLVELDLATANWRSALERALAQPLALDVRLVLDAANPAAVHSAVALLPSQRLVRIGAFQRTGDSRHVTDARADALLRDALAAHGLTTPVVGGSRSHYTELNREGHRLPPRLDGLAVTFTPLFHSLGTEQLIESVAIQRLIAEAAVAYIADTPVHIGPITLRPRFNDVATAPEPAPSRADFTEGYGAELTGSVDPRQSAPQLGAWLIASSAALAIPGVVSLSYFEEWGPRGIRSSAGEPTPAFDAINAVAGLAGSPLLSGTSPDGLVWAVGALTDSQTSTVLVANLDTVARDIDVTTPTGIERVLVAPFAWQFLSGASR